MKKITFADYIADGSEVKTNYYETAAWYKTIRLDKGEHPISAEFRNENEIVDLVWFSIPGIVVEDYFQSLWCGVPIGGRYDLNKNKGKQATWRSSFYCHALAKNLIEGVPTKFVLRPEFKPIEIKFVSYEGKNCTTYAICRR